MELKRGALVLWITFNGIIHLAIAVDPHYLERAQILNREEVRSDTEDSDRFEASARRCRVIGEKAARKRISCIADTDFLENLSNRVHMSRILPNADEELWDLAYKISKCSLSYSKYFEHACKVKSMYLNDRRRCRRLSSRQARTECKGEIQRKYHRHG